MILRLELDWDDIEIGIRLGPTICGPTVWVPTVSGTLGPPIWKLGTHSVVWVPTVWGLESGGLRSRATDFSLIWRSLHRGLQSGGLQSQPTPFGSQKPDRRTKTSCMCRIFGLFLGVLGYFLKLLVKY